MYSRYIGASLIMSSCGSEIYFKICMKTFKHKPKYWTIDYFKKNRRRLWIQKVKPMHYYRRGKNWLYGDVLCRILLFLLAANRAAGIFFLTAVAVDRYFKIVHPMNWINQMGLGYALWVSLALWALIFLATGYLLANKHLFPSNNRTQCESFNICMGFGPLSTWHNAFYIIQFFLPTVIVAFCTIRITWQLKSRTVDRKGKIKRAVQFVLAVALIFITCFFPSTISRIAVWILKVWYNECRYFEEANLAFYTSVCFTYFNSVLNPVVYYFSSPAFSGAFDKVLNKLLRRSDDKDQTESTDNDISTVDGRRM
ncbi:putative hydroxycarboxylic acid receptor 3-like [Scophthalmus maximus]|uniref:Putative hydroxycarboxylic acid receptor 3-like n=1 Tax=Scophthalmus maximus TaxID=52904 RepID=A0A2U9AWB1_SCOMX|nr:putative hydroxycarboxylic acid receptor 3-like [Scophthalmus maximus]